MAFIYNIIKINWYNNQNLLVNFKHMAQLNLSKFCKKNNRADESPSLLELNKSESRKGFYLKTHWTKEHCKQHRTELDRFYFQQMLCWLNSKMTSLWCRHSLKHVLKYSTRQEPAIQLVVTSFAKRSLLQTNLIVTVCHWNYNNNDDNHYRWGILVNKESILN